MEWLLKPLELILHLAGFAIELLLHAFEEAPFITFIAVAGLIWIVMGRRSSRRPFRKSLFGAAALLVAAFAFILIKDLVAGRVSLFR